MDEAVTTDAVAGPTPLTGRTEPWMEELLAHPDRCAALIEEYGSPVNVLDFAPLGRNAAELVEAAASEGVRLGVYVARKANKALGLVHEARRVGLGIDVASLAELTQCLDVGFAAEDMILTAAVKSPALIEAALATGVLVSLDNADEAEDVASIARARGVTARVAPRLASSGPTIAPTRFGMTARDWDSVVGEADGGGSALRLEGIHFHLNGYSARERAIVLREALTWTDALRSRGQAIAFIDMGGGVPMRYLEDREQWRSFWEALEGDDEGVLTWRGDRLGLHDPRADRPSATVYPYWQERVRGEWLRDVLAAPAGEGSTVARELAARGLELRCEPGRSVLDGCGLTLASVAFRKSTSDGVPLVGLHMNRTQVRSTSADFLVDPRWVRPSDAGDTSEPFEGFLVGAYCVEEELLLRRRLRFPDGVARGDIAAFVNTGGYLMHILESASHQLPLAATVVRRRPQAASGSSPGSESAWVRDGIDAMAATGAASARGDVPWGPMP